MPGSVIGNTSASGSGILSSGLSLASNVGFSLSGNKIKILRNEKECRVHNECKRANGAMAPEFPIGTK
jgi:hypothetical protein